MEKELKLKDILDIGGKISIYRPNGSTNNIGLSKLLKKQEIKFEEEKYLVYLTYSNISQIQAVFLCENPSDGNSTLKELYNKLNEI